MTEARAIVLIVLGAMLLEAIAILGLAAAGVTGPVLSLGAIVPLALASLASSSVVGHYGESGKRRR